MPRPAAPRAAAPRFAALREAEIAAERIVGLVRMLAAALLAAALLAAVTGSGPSESGADAPLFARQYQAALATLAAYFLLGGVAVAVARRHLFRPWMPWLSGGLDVAFALSALWFSLTNTGLSANYAAAMPAAWLVPLILCLGAQRFNTLLQVFLTVLLAAGLVVVPALAGSWQVFAAGDGSVDLFFALPPNIMRWVMIVAAGATIALAVARTHRLLDRMVDEARRRAALTRYLPAELAPRLADQGDRIGFSQRQTVAVLFVDIRGFTARAERMAPEALSAFVGDYRKRIQAAAGAHGGIIDKFIGDAAMLLFGAIGGTGETGKGGETDAAASRAALACGRSVLREVADWNGELAATGRPPVAVGVGIHAGTVFCGTVGGAERLEFTVLGDAVNVAARLEALSKTLGTPLVVSEAVLRMAGLEPARDGWRDLGRQAIPGRADDMRLYTAPNPGS